MVVAVRSDRISVSIHRPHVLSSNRNISDDEVIAQRSLTMNSRLCKRCPGRQIYQLWKFIHFRERKREEREIEKKILTTTRSVVVECIEIYYLLTFIFEFIQIILYTIH